MTVEIKSLSGIDAVAYFDDLSRLRIEVFRAFPYLYDGSLAHERKYLATYADTEGAVRGGALRPGLRGLLLCLAALLALLAGSWLALRGWPNVAEWLP